ncbi:MAG: DUF4197 domain-containing protein [Desulfobacteraceae bacterium]|nr:DUF4197 domain-containing protein [Desulfobacteraceae bacterium]
MKNIKKIIISFLFILLLSGCQTGSGNNLIGDVINILQSSESNGANPTIHEIGQAFKQALRIGSENVVQQLSAFNGFNADPAIHIPLPEELQNVKKVLSKIGMSRITDNLEVKLNRAAEVAAQKAKKLFWQAITEMTFNDVKNIYNGPKDSATKYFQSKMSASLSNEMRPIVRNSLSKVGAIKAYDNVMSNYQALPFVPDVKANLTDHVVKKGLDGIFHYIAKEEAAIRENPVRHTTELLKKVFGNRL